MNQVKLSRVALVGCSLLIAIAVATRLLTVQRTASSRVDLVFYVNIRGSLVDAATSKPVFGAWVIPMRSLEGTSTHASVLARKKWLETAYEMGRPLDGGARSERDGSFDLVFPISWHAQGRPPPPFHDIKGLWIQKPGCAGVAVATNTGQWIEHSRQSGIIFASLNMGVVRLQDKP